MKKLLYGCLLSIAFLFAGCSQENTMPEISQQEQSLNELKAIAAEYGFPYMPISYESNQPLTDEYRNEFISKLIELKEIRDNAKEVVMPDSSVLSRALSDKYYHGAVTIDGCPFPISIFWDEQFSGNSLYAIAEGVCYHGGGYPSHNKNVKKVRLSHITTKKSASSIPNLYFVLRCNLTGYFNNGSVSYRKHVEFIVKLDVERLNLQTTITVLADNYWHPRDFPID